MVTSLGLRIRVGRYAVGTGLMRDMSSPVSAHHRLSTFITKKSHHKRGNTSQKLPDGQSNKCIT